MDFVRVDPGNSAQFDAWFAIVQRSEEVRAPDEPGWHPEEWRARASDPEGALHHELFTLLDESRGPVAVGALKIPREDHPSWFRAELFVDPPRRRHGFGALTLAMLERRTRELGRSTLLFWVTEGAHERGRGPNRYFAPRQGYDVVEENIQRDLTWPRPAGELEELKERWRPHGEAYDLLSWVAATPEALLEERAHLAAIMPVEAPQDGFSFEQEFWDASRVRHHERRTAAMGRDLLVAVARHRERRELVGFSELSVSRDNPGTAYQWDTLVVREHRGHRLGGLLKVTTMRLLHEGRYATNKITTFNSALNAPMIALNEQLGARASGGVVVWRKNLE